MCWTIVTLTLKSLVYMAVPFNLLMTLSCKFPGCGVLPPYCQHLNVEFDDYAINSISRIYSWWFTKCWFLRLLFVDSKWLWIWFLGFQYLLAIFAEKNKLLSGLIQQHISLFMWKILLCLFVSESNNILNLECGYFNWWI